MHIRDNFINMNGLKKLFGHLHTINSHRRIVRKGCFKIGLYWQGITHDLSKYSPTEFLVGVKFYQGFRSPNNAEREAYGLSYSWLHHKGRNKHHYEYWTDYNINKDSQEVICPVKMPNRYIAEMFMDRVAACKIYNKASYTDKDPLAYYSRFNHDNILENETRIKLQNLLEMLADKGETETYKYIKNVFLKEVDNT